MGRSFRHRSSSGGSYTEMTSEKPSQDAAQELFRILLNIKNHRGKSLLHSLDSPSSLCTAHVLLQRALQLKGTTYAHDLLLQPDLESGYTPLHWAVYNGNLAAILLFLRYNRERLAGRPMFLLEQEAVGKQDLLTQMVQAVDHEGLSALQLLSKLQCASLEKCRLSLARKAIAPAASAGTQNAVADDQNELSLLSQNMHLLQQQENETQEESKEWDCACEVLTFGRANHCALGVAPGSDASSLHPQRVHAFALDAVGSSNAAVAVAAATHHTLVVTRNGALYSCGLGKGGRLGTGDERHWPLPVRVMGSLSRRNVIHVAAAENHSLCVTSDGAVYAFGSNRFGQLGCSSDIRCFLPRRLDDFGHCVAVAAGERHSMALTRDGQVYTWGDNQDGQLGGARRTGRVQRVDSLWNATPRKVAIAIAASEHSSLALVRPTVMGLPANNVYSWGHGNTTPIRVNFNNNQVDRDRRVNPIDIACAKYHNAAVTDDGQVFTWGLHAEPLGTGSKTKQARTASHSMVIASPQLVTGMLPENGGGIAVAVSASEHHTAVVTDCGHLYTWGATYGKDVLGHEGVTWQPDPKKVSGVHRAVGGAAAKEHNVMLIGTSFPQVPPTLRESSLETLAARQVARHVDLFNVIPILITAERIECTLLKEYCYEFVRLNMDGVLTLGRKSEMDCFLNEQLAAGVHSDESKDRDTECHPLLYDVITAGASSCLKEADSTTWMEACTEILDRLPMSTLVKYRKYSDETFSSRILRRLSRSLSIHEERENATIVDAAAFPSDRCLSLTAVTDFKSCDAAQSRVDSLSKEVRNVRKRLSQIAKLQTADSLTPEQQQKVGRKLSLETDLAILEPALENVEERLRELKLEEESCLQTMEEEEEVVEEECAVKEFEEVQDTVTAAEPKVFRCDVCGITCSDSNNLALHMNGRKHRNRVIQAKEEEKKQVAASILKDKQQRMLQSDVAPRVTPAVDKKGAWMTPESPVQPKYRLPPPPHFPSLEEATSKAPPSRPTKSTWNPLSPGAAKTRPKVGFQPEKALKSPSTKLLSPGPIPELKSPPWASPVAQVPTVATAGLDLSSPASQESRKTYSLGDFLQPQSASPAKAPSPAPWCTSTPSLSNKKPAPETPTRSFLDIQQEEENIRSKQPRSNSVEGKWFIERRERAVSISAIQEAEEKDREHRLLVEEQKQIEEQIELERRQQEKKKKKKARNRTYKKKNKGNGGTTSGKGKKPGQPGGGRQQRSGKNKRNETEEASAS